MITRIQRSRRRGCTLPPDAVCVTRPGPFGNPFSEKWFREHGYVYSAKKSVEIFDDWLLRGGWNGHFQEYRANMIRLIPTLKGKPLACWCMVDAIYCHGNTLLREANT